MKPHLTIPTAHKRPKPISCDNHDYIEIACMYKYDLKLDLRNGETLDVKPITTVTRKNELGFPVEYLVAESTTRLFDIALNEISKIQVKNNFAKFQSISFAGDN